METYFKPSSIIFLLLCSLTLSGLNPIGLYSNGQTTVYISENKDKSNLEFSWVRANNEEDFSSFLHQEVYWEMSDFEPLIKTAENRYYFSCGTPNRPNSCNIVFTKDGLEFDQAGYPHEQFKLKRIKPKSLLVELEKIVAGDMSYLEFRNQQQLGRCLIMLPFKDTPEQLKNSVALASTKLPEEDASLKGYQAELKLSYRSIYIRGAGANMLSQTLDAISLGSKISSTHKTQSIEKSRKKLEKGIYLNTTRRELIWIGLGFKGELIACAFKLTNTELQQLLSKSTTSTVVQKYTQAIDSPIPISELSPKQESKGYAPSKIMSSVHSSSTFTRLEDYYEQAIILERDFMESDPPFITFKQSNKNIKKTIAVNYSDLDKANSIIRPGSSQNLRVLFDFIDFGGDYQLANVLDISN